MFIPNAIDQHATVSGHVVAIVVDNSRRPSWFRISHKDPRGLLNSGPKMIAESAVRKGYHHIISRVREIEDSGKASAQINYEIDCLFRPNYHDGRPRKSWDDLGELERSTWEPKRNELCNYARAGTWGHECGKPATHAASFQSDQTKSGIYYGRRCDDCATIEGGENAGVISLEPLDQHKHRNDWK